MKLKIFPSIKRWVTSERGFTLVEFLIVIGLVIILSTIVLINLGGRNQSEKFHSSVLRLVGVMTEAIDNSKTLKDVDTEYSNFYNTVWSVDLTPSGCSGGPGYTLFITQGPFIRSYGKYVLPDGVDYDRDFTFLGLPSPSCGPKKIEFELYTGKPKDLANANLRIYLVSNPEVSSTISISPLGQVLFTSSEGSLGS